MLKTRKTLTIAAIVIPVCIVLVLVSSVSLTNYQQRIDQEKEVSLVDQARKEFELKNYTKTESLLNEALSHVSDDKEAIILYDKVLRTQGKIDESTKLLEAHKNIRDTRIFDQLAQNYLDQQDFDTALGYADMSTSMNSRDSTAFILKMKIYNLTMDKDTALKTIEQTDSLYLDKDAKFYRAVTLLNFGVDAVADLENQKLNFPESYTQLIDSYKTNYPNTTASGKELEAKANIEYSLINLNLFELAYPYAQDMATLNRFYENSLLYRALINIHFNNTEAANEDLDVLERYYPNKYTTQIFYLEIDITENNLANLTETLGKLISRYKPENQAQFFEIIKLLYVRGYYEQVCDAITKMEPKMAPYTRELDFMLIKSSVYANRFAGMSELSDQVNLQIANLNHEQKADLYAIRALLASKAVDSAGASTFMQQATELNQYSSFIHYINWMINKNPADLTRAKELDIKNELPKNI